MMSMLVSVCSGGPWGSIEMQLVYTRHVTPFAPQLATIHIWPWSAAGYVGSRCDYALPAIPRCRHMAARSCARNRYNSYAVWAFIFLFQRFRVHPSKARPSLQFSIRPQSLPTHTTRPAPSMQNLPLRPGPATTSPPPDIEIWKAVPSDVTPMADLFLDKYGGDKATRLMYTKSEVWPTILDTIESYIDFEREVRFMIAMDIDTRIPVGLISVGVVPDGGGRLHGQRTLRARELGDAGRAGQRQRRGSTAFDRREATPVGRGRQSLPCGPGSIYRSLTSGSQHLCR